MSEDGQSQAVCRFRARTMRGFTLLEMTLAIGVFAALLAGIFGIVVASTELAGDLAYAQQQESARRAMRNLLRRAFAELPPQAIVELRGEGSGVKALQEVVFPSQSPVFQMAGSDPDADGEILLRTEERTGGYLAVVLAWRDASGKANGEDAAVMELLPELAQFRWRFFDAAEGEWRETWEPERGRTRLVELEWEMAGAPRVRDVFTIFQLEQPNGRGGGSPAQIEGEEESDARQDQEDAEEPGEVAEQGDEEDSGSGQGGQLEGAR